MAREKVYSRTEPRCSLCHRPFKQDDEIVQVLQGKYVALPYMTTDGYEGGIEEAEYFEYHLECKPTNIRLVKEN